MQEQMSVVVTTSDQVEVLNTIAQSVVEEKLAACCQISGPIQSHYRWQGKTESAQEWKCEIKTFASLFDPLSKRITELHNYDVPEIIALNVTHVHEPYRTWASGQTNSD